MRKRFICASIVGICASAIALSVRGDVPPVKVDTTPRAASSNDWPQWRGPNRDDVSTETGLLKQWPRGGPTLLWETKDVGAGFSSVSVAGGHIYTIGYIDGSALAMALDMSGKRRWATKLGAGEVDHPGPRSTPTVDGDRVYAMDEVGNLACLQTADGKQLWHVNLQRDLGGVVMSGWGFAESPMVDGNKLLCTPGGPRGTVAALDKMTGKVLWRTRQLTDPCAYCSLVPAQIGGTHQYVLLTGSHIAGIDSDGKVLWQADRRGQTAVIPTPIVHEDLVFVTSGYGVGCNCFKVSGSGSSFSASQIYENRELICHHGGAVCVGDYVYGVTDSQRGTLVCLELKTGKLVWKDKSIWKDGNAGAKGSLTCADGNLYVRGEAGAGTIALVEATPKGYHELGRFDPPDRSTSNSWSHPVVADGKLFLRDQNVLLCYNVKESTK
jgi:outer membrane protein assembly factor BamB